MSDLAPPRVILHPGFHKTGTSTLQRYLTSNRWRFLEHAQVFAKANFIDAGDLATAYGLQPGRQRLLQFQAALSAFLADIPDHKLTIISCEGFSGVMPGLRRPVTGTVRNFHRAAIPLARVIDAELRRRFGADLDLCFFYTLRGHESWIKSVYGHLLHAIRLTQDFESFRAGFRNLIHLDQQAEKIAASLPNIRLETAWLEDQVGRHEGPAAALLDLIELPQEVRKNLPAPSLRNSGFPPELQGEFLALNRRIKDRAELKARKRHLAAEHRGELAS